MRRRHGGRPARAHSGALAALALGAVALTGALLAPLHSCSALEQAPLSPAPGRWTGAGPSDIRIRLAHNLRAALFEPQGEVRLFAAGAVAAPLTLRQPFRVVRASRRSIVVQRSDGGELARFSAAQPLVVEAAQDSSPASVRFGQRVAQRLVVRASRGDAAGLDVVEIAPLERYLAQVVTAELYPDWAPAAYEAQAIAARSYALHERWRRRRLGSHFDVEADTRDQAYATQARPRAVEAVEKTRNTVLLHDGAVLRAYYASACGGRPASAADTWPTGPGFAFNLAPPLQAQPRSSFCQASPRFRWTVVRDRGALVQRLRAWAAANGSALRSIRSLSAVQVQNRNAAGRPSRYRLVDASGAWWTLSAESLRLAMNYTGDGAPPLDRKDRVHSGDVEIAVDQDVVRINGRGFGHGVGMCQFGAQALARQGRTAEEILQFFYPGAVVATIDLAQAPRRD